MKKHLFTAFLLMCTLTIKAQLNHIGAYVTTWDTQYLPQDNILLNDMIGASYYWEKVGEESTINSGLSYTTTSTVDVLLPILKNSGVYKIYIKGITSSPHYQGGFYSRTSSQYQALVAVNDWGGIQWTNMSYFFPSASNLNSIPADAPNLTLVTDMSGMFFYASSFNQRINHWNVSNVTQLGRMLEGATAFNQNLEAWNVFNVTNMSRMFFGATAFNKPLNNWSVNNVTSMHAMFSGATAFNMPLQDWNINKVTDISNMFYGATSFNQPINKWCLCIVDNTLEMFEGATAFNQPLDNWNVSTVVRMDNMFRGATAFNQNLAVWKLNNQVSLAGIFSNTALNCVNYSLTLKGWATDVTENGKTFNTTLNLSNTPYSTEVLAQRQLLINAGIAITGDTENTGCTLLLLPVTLESFTAKQITKGSLLTWKTLSEKDNAYYLLERSTNGADFVPLTKVTALGNAGSTYSYTDLSPFPGDNYYRLSQVDKDGTLVILDIKALSYNLANNVLKIYPSPIVGNNLNVSLSGYPTKALPLFVYNLLGQKVYSDFINTATKNISTKLDKGIYLLEVEGYAIQKFIVQ